MAAAQAPGSVRLASAGLRALPDFLIIGTQKGGTSSLYQYLIQHPDVLPAQKKEVHYFGWEYAHGEAWYRAHFPLRASMRVRRTLRRAQPLTGEATPYYLFHPHVPRRVADLVPQARLIVLLRNPVDRAVSSYLHQVRQGREPLSFREALERENERLAVEAERMASDPLYNSQAHRHFSYRSRGLYADQLEAWFAVFPRERFLILRSEDFFKDTPSTYAQAVDFLGLRPWRPPVFQRYNVARKHGSDARRDEEARVSLAEFFAPHNRRLESLLGRDLGWSGS